MKASITIGSLVAALWLAGCNASSGDTRDTEDRAHAGPAMNFHRINSALATGGHLTGDTAIQTLVEQGVTLVIDLRDAPPDGHEQRLADAGIRWENVPVVWDDPKLADFAAFSELMADAQDENILVQCQANYRASAMTYAYRVTSGDATEADARKDLEVVWTPEGRWETFLTDILESN